MHACSGEGALPIAVFLDAVAQIAEVYDMLFSVQMIAKQLKGDINNSIAVRFCMCFYATAPPALPRSLSLNSLVPA